VSDQLNVEETETKQTPVPLVKYNLKICEGSGPV